MNGITRKQLRWVLNKIKANHNLTRVETKGVCCGTCSAYEYETTGSRIIWNKWFASGANKSDWDSKTMYIAYNIDFEEMNSIGEFMVKEFKNLGFDYTFEKLENDNCCLTLKLITGEVKCL